MPSSCSSSEMSSSSLSSIYTFRNPSNFNTSPCAVSSSLFVEIEIFAVVLSSSASDIWHAMVLFHINSYNLLASESSTVEFSIYVGLIASCASCAVSFLFLNFLGCAYFFPYCSLICLLMSSMAVSLRFTLSVRM